jgi:hypothetical protein
MQETNTIPEYTQFTKIGAKWFVDQLLSNYVGAAVVGFVGAGFIMGMALLLIKNHGLTTWKRRLGFFCLMSVSIFAVAHILMSVTVFFAHQIGESASRIPASAIRGSVKKCAMPDSPDGKGFYVVFNLRLTNPGKPTTAWSWKLRAKLPGGQQYEYNPLEQLYSKFTFELQDTMDTNAPPVVVTHENYLPSLLLEKTVGPDRGAHGWICFQVTDIPKEQMAKSGTQFVIELEQGDGSKRTVEHIWTNPQ